MQKKVRISEGRLTMYTLLAKRAAHIPFNATLCGRKRKRCPTQAQGWVFAFSELNIHRVNHEGSPALHMLSGRSHTIIP